MSGGAPQEHEAPLADINVTPLVDVMLVLLVIFIVLAPMFSQAMRVNLPPLSAPALVEPVVINVSITAPGALHLNGQIVTSGSLQAQLQQLLAKTPGAVIRLAADHSISYGQVARVIELVQSAGGGKLAFATGAPRRP